MKEKSEPAESSHGTSHVDLDTERPRKTYRSLAHPGMGGGPCGFGDPNDRILRKVEKEYLIPRQIKAAATPKCSAPYDKLMDCIKEFGSIKFMYQCTEQRDTYNRCMLHWCNDDDFIKEQTELYLQERSTYRETCVNAKQRKYFDIRWKRYLKAHPEEAKKYSEDTPTPAT